MLDEKYISSKNTTKTITFVLTENCQLDCKYCFLINKNSINDMDFTIAKLALNKLFEDNIISKNEKIIFDFIGGEPLLKIELIDKITDYIKNNITIKYKLNDYKFSILTNGILYNDKKVQNYILKNKEKLIIRLSIDGNKKEHDQNRIDKNKKGSFYKIINNISIWLKQFPDGEINTTLSSNNINYLKSSIIYLWSLGIKNVKVSIVLENTWKIGDEIEFENQLKHLADYIIENNLYDKFYCSLFNKNIGYKTTKNQNWCGCGKNIIAIDSKGNFYPCYRFLSFALKNKQPLIIGNYKDGINFNKLRPFQTLDRLSQSSEECKNCKIANGCSWCVALNYDESDTGTIYQRVTYICKIHKARVNANNYYWNKMKHIISK